MRAAIHHLGIGGVRIMKRLLITLVPVLPYNIRHIYSIFNDVRHTYVLQEIFALTSLLGFVTIIFIIF